MTQFIGCNAHKKFSVFASMNEKGEYNPTVRVSHDREAFRQFLQEIPPKSEIGLETSGCYYWMVDEMERAEHVPRLARLRDVHWEIRRKQSANSAKRCDWRRDLPRRLTSWGWST